MQLPNHIHVQGFDGERLYVKRAPGLVSLLDSEWTPDELRAIAADIAARAAYARVPASAGCLAGAPPPAAPGRGFLP